MPCFLFPLSYFCPDRTASSMFFCVVSGRPRLLAVFVCVLSADSLAGLCGFFFPPQRQNQLGKRHVGGFRDILGGICQLEKRKTKHYGANRMQKYWCKSLDSDPTAYVTHLAMITR